MGHGTGGRVETGRAPVRSAPALWSTVLRRTRADRVLVLVVWLLILSAVALVDGGTVYGATVARTGLRQAVLAASPAERLVSVRTTTRTADLASLDPATTQEVARSIASIGGDVSRTLRTDAFAPSGAAPADVADLTELASFGHLDRHATLVAGRWPAAGSATLEATLSEAAASALGRRIGDVVSLASRTEPAVTVTLRVVGIWRRASADPYWTADPIDLAGVDRQGGFTTRGPYAVAETDLLRLEAGGSVTAEWRAVPDLEALTPEAVDAFVSSLSTMGARLRAGLSANVDLSMTSDLPAIVAAANRAVLTARGSIVLLTLEFALLAGYAILLAAALLAERRRAEVALLRARGASAAHLAALAFGEALVLCVPAAVAGPLLGLGAVALVGTLGPLAGSGLVSGATIDASLLAPTALTVAACVAGLVLPTLVPGGRLATIRASIGRQVGRTLATRLGLDLVLLLSAGIALWQLRLYGTTLAPGGTGEVRIDPILVAAPGLGLLAGGLVATRFVPRLAELGERAMAGRRGLLAPLAARELARRSLRYTRATLLLVLAAALGTFAAVYGATWSRSQVDQAAYQVPADVRVVASPFSTVPEWAYRPALLQLGGVRDASAALRVSLDAGRAVQGGTLLAVDGRSAATRTALERGGLDPSVAERLPSLAASRPAVSGVSLPGSPDRFAFVLDAALVASALEGDGTLGPAVAGGTVQVTALVSDADGLHRIPGGSMGFTGQAAKVVVPLAASLAGKTVRLVPPVSVAGLEVTIAPPEATSTGGTIEVRGLTVPDAAADGGWSSVPLDPTALGWTWQGIDARGDAVTAGGSTPARLVVGADADTSPAIIAPPETGATATYRVDRTPDAAAVVPAIVSDAFLAATGTSVGDVVSVTSQANPVRLRVVASVARFPSVDPAAPLAVVDLPTMSIDAFATDGSVLAPGEWWLAVDPGSAAAVSAAVGRAPFAATTVVDRAAVEATNLGDPVGLGIVGVLLLGSLVSVVVAAIGFLVTGTLATDERRVEIAFLQAQGVGTGAAWRWILGEQVVVLAFSAVLGAALGVGLAWVVVPAAALTATGAAPVPPPALVVPLEIVPAVAAVACLLALGLGLAVGRRLPGRWVGHLLREGEGA